MNVQNGAGLARHREIANANPLTEGLILSYFGKGESRSLWPSGLRRRSAAARLLALLYRIPPGTWMPASCECCVLSGRGICDGLITRPEESCGMWRACVCDVQTSIFRRPRPIWVVITVTLISLALRARSRKTYDGRIHRIFKSYWTIRWTGPTWNSINV